MGCDFLQERVTTGDAREFIGLLENSALRGAGLVRQILSFGRGLTGANGRLDLRHLVDEVANLAQATFPKSVTIVADAPADLWPVEADATQLHQVLLNLAINARDATTGEGRIVLQARNREQASTSGTLRGSLPNGACVQLSVSDTGSGITPAHAAKIFEPFFSTKAPGRGTGLGLSTVATIVRSLGGAIELTTEEGKGSTFSVYLPAATAPAAAPAALPDELSPTPGAGRNLLIADDEIAVATIMSEMLENAGYRVKMVNSGLAALAAAAEQQPDLVLLDLMMPGATGQEICACFGERFPDLPIVAISGFSAEEIAREAAGAVGALEKPFSRRQLLETVRAALAPVRPPAPVRKV